ETEGFSPKTAAIFTNRSVRRGSPKSAAPKVSTAHSSAFSSSLTFMTRSPLLIHAPFFTNALTCVEVSVSFRDYVHASASLENSALAQRSREYWTQRLSSLPPAPDLPLASDSGREKR